ncbi:hypothetical protein Q4565_18655, partial [Leptospira santarosai]|nr:hypothetical protein [Leptospira santarosai]
GAEKFAVLKLRSEGIFILAVDFMFEGKVGNWVRFPFQGLNEAESFPPNSNRLRLPEFVREKIPSPAIPLVTTDKNIQPEHLSIFEEGEFIQIAS